MDLQAWILAKGIENQFGDKRARHVLHLAPRVIALSHFVRKNIRRFGYDEAEQREIDEAWRELEDRVRKIVAGQGGTIVGE